MAYIIQWINNTLTRQFVGSFGLALAFIGLAWALTTRSVRRVVMALIPNILPLLAVLGALGLTGVPLKPTTAMVFSIGLGIAVDDTIHFIAAYERWRKNNPGCTSEEAALHAYQTAGRSMLDTSIVLMAGMLVMRERVQRIPVPRRLHRMGDLRRTHHGSVLAGATLVALDGR